MALAWVKCLSGKDGNPVIVPIPGASSAAKVEENCADITMSAQDEMAINEILASFKMQGARYGGPAAKYMDG